MGYSIQSTPELSPRLDMFELDALRRNEVAVERGLNTFVEVGNALAAIRDGKLYREKFATFEDYCQERWGFTGNYARRQIEAAEVIKNVPMGTLLPTSERQARPLTRLEPSEQIAAWQEAVETAPNGKVTAAHVTEVVERRNGATPYNNHAISDDPNYDGDEWFTPSEYVEAARLVMGGIDLDPASHEAAQVSIKAGAYYTKDTNGLARPWFGRVWLNPPYSMPLVKDFILTAIDEYESGHITSAVILTNNSSDTSWFHALLAMYPACFTRGRVQFWRPNVSAFSARQGQVFFYLGDTPQLFAETFSQFGIVVNRWKNDN